MSKPAPAPVPPAPETPPPAPDGVGKAPHSAVSGREDFAAQLEAFSGPLDLLLYLIKENEVAITDIPIARILEQYLRYLDAATEWDLHLAGEFLVVATTLMEIKSRELLPTAEAAEGEELIEDPRSELVRQLLRYKQLKERARLLEARLELWSRRRPRGAYDDVPEAPAGELAEPPEMPDVDLYVLLTLFEKLRRSVLAQAPGRVAYEGETLEEKLGRIEQILKERPFARFTELLGGAIDRPEIALTFIALLELVRRRLIRLMQPGAYGTLEVKVQQPAEAEALARQEAAAAADVVDVALREKAEREAKLAADAAAQGLTVDQLPWKKRRAALARPKFEGVVRPEDLEEIDAEEAEIARRVDAILAAADVISQRFEESRLAEGAALPGPPAADAAAQDETPVTPEDLKPTPGPQTAEGPPPAGNSPASD